MLCNDTALPTVTTAWCVQRDVGTENGQSIKYSALTVAYLKKVAPTAVHCQVRLNFGREMTTDIGQKNIDPVMVNNGIMLTFSRLMTYIYIYICRTALLTSSVAFHIFIQQIYVLNILNMLHTLRFFLFKMLFIS